MKLQARPGKTWARELERLLEQDEDLRELVETWLAESGKATDDLEAALDDPELVAVIEQYLESC